MYGDDVMVSTHDMFDREDGMIECRSCGVAVKSWPGKTDFQLRLQLASALADVGFWNGINVDKDGHHLISELDCASITAAMVMDS